MPGMGGMPGMSGMSGMPGMPQGGPAPAGGDADPYAAYGGYNNYIALWYAAVAQQGQQPPQQ